ncbi:hypothetical protein T12_5431 [Trichinella patagoniensis]|uniref:Uncharacterized protein n=1 Tax=Trichinella patagoniensis TaxID=990121 RepID=A0A0V1A9D1_9BILA|nr:hypothetical protein T12_5431 [Trichinella patagoniensis]
MHKKIELFTLALLLKSHTPCQLSHLLVNYHKLPYPKVSVGQLCREYIYIPENTKFTV